MLCLWHKILYCGAVWTQKTAMTVRYFPLWHTDAEDWTYLCIKPTHACHGHESLTRRNFVTAFAKCGSSCSAMMVSQQCAHGKFADWKATTRTSNKQFPAILKLWIIHVVILQVMGEGLWLTTEHYMYPAGWLEWLHRLKTWPELMQIVVSMEQLIGSAVWHVDCW